MNVRESECRLDVEPTRVVSSTSFALNSPQPVDEIDDGVSLNPFSSALNSFVFGGLRGPSGPATGYVTIRYGRLRLGA